MPVCASRNLPIFLVWTAEFEPLHTSTLPAKPSAFLSPSSLRDCPGQVKDSKWMGSNTNRLDLTRQKSGTRSRRLFLMTWICNEFYLDSELRRMELISNAVVTVFYCILQWDMKHDSAKCWKSTWIWFLTKPLSSWLIMHMSFMLVFHQSACISATKRKMSTITTYVPYPGVLSSTYVLLVTAMYASV